jgi:hypothetical protein
MVNKKGAGSRYLKNRHRFPAAPFTQSVHKWTYVTTEAVPVWRRGTRQNKAMLVENRHQILGVPGARIPEIST